MEKKEDGVKKVAVEVAAPEEATPTLTATPSTLTAPLHAPEKEKEPEMQEKCYKKNVGEEATFLETAKDYFNQFKVMPAQKHWTCVKNYFNQKCASVNQKCASVFGKQKVEPVVKDETKEVVAKPATAAVEST